MQDKNKPGLRFYAPSADAQLRAAISRAHERGVEWQRIEGVLKDEEGREAAESIRLIDGLKPLLSSPDDIDEMPTSPSLDKKHEAWTRLNRAFK
jgi:hypothetical protein